MKHPQPSLHSDSDALDHIDFVVSLHPSSETINKGQIQISFAVVVDVDNGEQQTTAQRHHEQRRR